MKSGRRLYSIGARSVIKAERGIINGKIGGKNSGIICGKIGFYAEFLAKNKRAFARFNGNFCRLVLKFYIF